MKRSLFIITLCLFISSITHAEKTDSTKKINPEIKNKPRHYVGASASTISMLGITYQFIHTRKVASKFKFFVYPDKYSSDQMWYFYGGEIQFTMNASVRGRTYLLLGFGGVRDNKGTSWSMFGAAIGYEYFIIRNLLAVNMDFGAGIMLGEGNPQVLPGIGAGIMFAF